MALNDMRFEEKLTKADEKGYYTTGQVAKLFGVTTRTVSNWCDQGRLPFIATMTGHRRIPTSAIKGGKAYDAKLEAFQAHMAEKTGGLAGEAVAEQVRERRAP
jgi:excisionase family DNA binding protein